MLRELVKLLDRHGDGRVLLSLVGDQFNGFPFRLRVPGELLEPTSLYEDFNRILQMDLFISKVSMCLPVILANEG